MSTIRSMKSLTILVFVLLASLPARATTLSGTVTDHYGAAIPNAFVVIHWDRVGLTGVKKNVGTKADKSITTNETGHFSLDLPPGVYDVFVSAAGFSPHCDKIVIREKGRNYNAKLTVSRMQTVIVDR